MTAAMLAPLPFPVNFGPSFLRIPSRRPEFPKAARGSEATRSFPPRTSVHFRGENPPLREPKTRRKRHRSGKVQGEGTVTFTDFVLEKTPQPQPKHVFTR